MYHDNLSIVVQGPYYDEGAEHTTAYVLKTYRKIFAEAEIILSTWRDSIDADQQIFKDLDIKVVFSDDPGVDVAGQVKFNLNRQLVSSRTGLAAATKKYVIKTRTDAAIHNDVFLHYYDIHIAQKPSGYCFKQPVVIYALSTRNWTKGFIPHLFHPCDWFYFGLREDIVALFDIPNIDERSLTYFKDKEKPRTPSFSDLAQYTPEQWIIVAYLIKKGLLTEEDFPYYCSRSAKAKALNYKVFAEDFLVLDADQLALFSWKYPSPHTRDMQISQLRHEEWVHMCKQQHMPFARQPLLYRIKRLLICRVNAWIGQAQYYKREWLK